MSATIPSPAGPFMLDDAAGTRKFIGSLSPR
jgi:hypothetical protein